MEHAERVSLQGLITLVNVTRGLQLSRHIQSLESATGDISIVPTRPTPNLWLRPYRFHGGKCSTPELPTRLSLGTEAQGLRRQQ